MPVQPMVARPASELPAGAGWSYEPKADGFRVIATVVGGRARLQSRRLRSLTRYFPEVVEALTGWFAGDVVLDGELVVVSRGGRLDFTALQRRLTTARAAADAPASYLAFDALHAGGTDLRGYPLQVRRAVLEQLLDGVRPPLAVMPMTTDGAAARAWLTEHLEAGIEGVVAKRLNQSYLPTHAWRKVRTRSSAEAIVGGVLGPISAPVALVLGRRDEQGLLRVVGRTGTLPRTVRAELGAVLRPAGPRHPWPPVLPPSRFGHAAPVGYVRVEPVVVVELLVDTAVDEVRGRPVWRHPARLLRTRSDLRAADL
ncbi:ATP-dependent DNA ligase [Pseudonocardia sichuanensis]